MKRGKMKLKKILIIIIVIILLLVVVYVLYPKDIGFIEKRNVNGFVETLGQYSECFGIKLSHEVGNRTNYKCIGIPFGRITI